MFFYLSKTIQYLLMPLSLVLLCTIGGWLWPGKRGRKIFRIAALFLFLIFTNGYLGNLALRALEYDPVPFAEVQESYEVGILLTGFTNMSLTLYDRLHFNEGADRLIHTIQLYKMGKIRHIVVTGAYKTLSYEVNQEGQLIAEYLLQSGIPESDFTIESEATNTHQNAVNTVPILNNKFPGGKYLLITSAFHMHRSLGCFRKQGVEVTPFPTDFRTSDHPFYYENFIPTGIALINWETVIHECMGIGAYELMGYM